MKKFLALISIISVILSVFVSCTKTQVEGEAVNNTTLATQITATNNASKYENFEQPVGEIETSEKVVDGDAYNIYYRDENGFEVKVEHYEGGKMMFYYIVKSADINGNSTQSDYYTPDGKYVATSKNGFFYDENGNQVFEDYVTNKLR